MISKQILPGSWFRDIPTAHLIDVHSRGFERGPLLKMAASEELMRADIHPEHGQSLIHLITTGAQEFYGPNSNSDGFNEKAADFKIPRHQATGKPAIYKMAGGLTEFHDTFLKYGAVYEEHFNSKKGGKPKGTIKMASYNPTMHRGELIVSVPNDTWAKDLNKLANGEPVYWSMGCGVKSDVCSMCENRAATRAQYCDHLRYNKLAIDKEGNQAFAINDEPHFHDISKVAVPADRIAFALRKVASGMSFIEMEQTAEGLYIPLGLIQKIGSATEARQAYALSKLAEIEKKIALKANPEDQHLAEAFGETQVPAETLKKMAAYALEDVLDACNRRHVMLPPQAFVHIVMNKAAAIPDLSGIGAALKDVFSTASAEDDQAVVSDSSYVVQCPGKYAGLEDLAESLRPAFSIDDEPVRHRIITSVIHGGPSLSKRANMLVTPNMSAETRYLAREYAKYQVAFLAGAGADKYAHRVVVHNQVMN